MRDIQGVVYFDGRKDYVFNLRDDPLNANNIYLCTNFEDFRKKSLEIMLDVSGIRSISLPTEDREDTTTREFARFVQDCVPEIRVIKQGGKAIEDLIKKYGLTDVQPMPFTLGPGLTYPAHVHNDTTEAFYVVKGIVAVGTDLYYEGDDACFQPGKPHHYRNPTDSNAELFLLFSPNYNPDDSKEAELKEEVMMEKFMLM